ncbi:MAG: cytochrome c biogenesis protein CcsA [Ignavibacteriae bacterium]|nr:cytochrome c biogenesis protein CcsA [Ignavibacteriota bacterium]
MIGGILVKLAFLTCLLSVACFYQTHRSGNTRYLKLGRAFFHATVISVLVIAATLLYLILTHQFQYTYVWSYSSRELSLPLLISTFYAGQEGSFMLWTLYTSLIGIFLMQYSSKKGYEPQVMSVYGLIELMLLLMLIVKNPFTFVWETWPGQVEAGFVPQNGRGLNPLLQNYWMVIHPQVLFTGFASMGVPYAYAVAAMMKRDYSNWIRPATPWIVYGATVLGTGIMMGGFWAYETLGWGGYWGWDPVENSSLVPWLFAIGSIHTILSQRKSGAFVRTNLMLAMLCFITVLYSTFLTRSGVLGDTSVHSFVDPGMWAYWLLIGIIILFVGLGFGLLVKRLREMPKVPPQHSYLSREFALFLGSATLVCAAIFVTVGTSSPIITEIIQGKTTAVDISYYVTTTLPLGIAIGLLTGLGQLLWWTRSDKRGFLRTLIWPVGLALFATAVIGFFGIESMVVALFVFGACFALLANIQVGWRIIKGNPKYAGGAIAHVGLAVMFLGFVGSGNYNDKQTISLVEGKSVDALGYTLTYVGYRPIDQEKYAFQVNVEKDGRNYHVAPIMYYSSYTEGLMRNPDIVNLITKDFYLAPLSLEQNGSKNRTSAQRLLLKKGESKTIADVEVTFVDFDFPVMEKAAMLEGKEVRIGAKLRIAEAGSKPVLITPFKIIDGGVSRDEMAAFEDRFEFTIVNMNPDREDRDNSRVELSVNDLSSTTQGQSGEGDVLVVEASVKPFINMVWSGVIILLVGFIVTIVRRTKEAALRNRNL